MHLHAYEGIVFILITLPDQLTAMKKRASEGSRGDQIIMWCILLIQEKGGGLNETLASPVSSGFYFFKFFCEKQFLWLKKTHCCCLFSSIFPLVSVRSCQGDQEAAPCGGALPPPAPTACEVGNGEHLPADRGTHHRLEVHPKHSDPRELHPYNHQLFH